MEFFKLGFKTQLFMLLEDFLTLLDFKSTENLTTGQAASRRRSEEKSIVEEEESELFTSPWSSLKAELKGVGMRDEGL